MSTSSPMLDPEVARRASRPSATRREIHQHLEMGFDESALPVGVQAWLPAAERALVEQE